MRAKRGASEKSLSYLPLKLFISDGTERKYIFHAALMLAANG